MDSLKIIGIIFLTFTFLSHLVYGADNTDNSGEIDVDQIKKDRFECRNAIRNMFGSKQNALDRARFAFDNFVKNDPDLTDDLDAYYKAFDGKLIPNDTLLDPYNFCQIGQLFNEERRSDCYEKVLNYYNSSPMEAIWRIYYTERRETSMYKVEDGTVLFNQDLIDYWDHLKMGFHLNNFPRLDFFCATQHPMPPNDE